MINQRNFIQKNINTEKKIEFNIPEGRKHKQATKHSGEVQIYLLTFNTIKVGSIFISLISNFCIYKQKKIMYNAFVFVKAKKYLLLCLFSLKENKPAKRETHDCIKYMANKKF